jgi:hypothetical protein
MTGDTVECGVFVTCYHQVIFELSQEERWRDLVRKTRLQQLTAALEQVTPMVAAQKRRHTRETLHRRGQRIAVRIEAQLGTLLVDLSKREKDSTLLQQPSRRKRKGMERTRFTSSSDIRDPQTRNLKLRCKRGSYVKAGEYMRSSAPRMRATHSNANPILQERVLSRYMRRRTEDHWDNQYEQTRTKGMGTLWKGPKSTGGKC